MQQRELSIITVCYNVENQIKCTIESVLEQKWQNYEYIFVDGKSLDSTLKVIESYREEFEKNNIPFVVVSEEDYGIYDAMNKGTRLANGKWLLFLNAGDCLYDETVLGQASLFWGKNVDVIYGNTLCKDGELYMISLGEEIENIKKRMIFCHQSSFIDRTMMLQFGYLLKYKLCADFDFFLRAYMSGARFYKMDSLISVFELGGPSNQKGFEVNRENARILFENKQINQFSYMMKMFEIGWKERLKPYIPRCILEYRIKQRKRAWKNIGEI